MKTTRLYALFALLMVFAVSCNKPDNPDDSGSANGHSYVDLGLPSGTLWATCNVGADKPEVFGDYFAWGETSPKTSYNWSTYQYCFGGSVGEYGCNTLTKYCDNSLYGYNGFTDSLTTLQAIDDAATVNWGNGWRTPTSDEWIELYYNTTSTMTTQNGVGGRLFIANNNKSLFLPATGYRWIGGLIYVDDACYWSSSLCTTDPVYFVSPDCAFFFGYWANVAGLGKGDRGIGFNVRPVRSSK